MNVAFMVCNQTKRVLMTNEGVMAHLCILVSQWWMHRFNPLIRCPPSQNKIRTKPCSSQCSEPQIIFVFLLFPSFLRHFARRFVLIPSLLKSTKSSFLSTPLLPQASSDVRSLPSQEWWFHDRQVFSVLRWKCISHLLSSSVFLCSWWK